MTYFVPRLDKAMTMFGLPNDNKYLLLLILAYIGLSHAVLEEKGRMKLKKKSPQYIFQLKIFGYCSLVF